MRHRSLTPVLMALITLATWNAQAQTAKVGNDALDQLAFSKAETWVGSDPVEIEQIVADVPAAVSAAVGQFRTVEGGQWRVLHDRVTGLPSLVEGSGIPWIPGAGNTLRLVDQNGGLVATGEAALLVPREVMVEKALSMIRAYPDMFGVEPSDLRLMEGASGPVLDYLYFLHFQWTYHGIPVENAYVVLRLNQEVGKAMQSAEMKSRTAAIAAQAMVLAPDAFAARLRGDHERLGVLVREIGLKAD